MQNALFKNLGKWKTLREEESIEEKSLNTAIVDGKIINSQEKLANKFSESFLNKICNIKNEMPANNILAEKIYKELVPRVEENFKIKEVKIKHG